MLNFAMILLILINRYKISNSKSYSRETSRDTSITLLTLYTIYQIFIHDIP